MAHIILDDTSSNFTCGDPLSLQCNNFSSVYSNSWLNGSAATDANLGPFTLTFSGISVAFYASGILDQTANATISVDGQKAVTSISSFKDPWFSTETLSDSQHNVTFDSIPDGFVIDYMVITPGNDTSLIGKQLIVDDTDPSFVYTGQWTRNTTILAINSNQDILDSSIYNGTSFGGGFQETQDPQASVKFTFIGTSVEVYGFYDAGYLPLLATFAIDGVNQITNYALSSYLEQAHFPWFQSNSKLSPGSHVLSISFGGPFSPSIGPGARFTLDYIIYTPSFSSLAAQGKSSSSNSGKRPILIGAIVGAIVGILLIACLTFVIRKRLVAQKLSALARLVPDPYRHAPNRAATPPTSRGPHIVPIVEFQKETLSVTPGRSADVAQVLPPDRSPPRLSEPVRQLPSTTISPPTAPGPSSIEARAHITAPMAERMQALADEIGEDIMVDGVMTSPRRNNGSPPPYETLIREGNL